MFLFPFKVQKEKETLFSDESFILKCFKTLLRINSIIIS